MSIPALEVRGLSKTFAGNVAALQPADFALDPGERWVLLGPSGSGKSTLLRCLAGLETPDAGEILVDGRRVDSLEPHLRGIGFVPQRPVLYPHMTVKQNLLTVVWKQPFPADIVERMNLGELLARFPHQLSGGETQRVVLAKLLIRKVGVWLLDEPFSGLDPHFRAEFRRELHLLIGLSSATMIFVTHDPADAWSLGRRVGFLNAGRLSEFHSPAELRLRPLTAFAAATLGDCTLIDGSIEQIGPEVNRSDLSDAKFVFVSECGSIRLPIREPESSRISVRHDRRPESPHRLTLGIRPDDVRVQLSDSSPWLLVSAEPAGSGWLLTVARGRTRLRTEWRSGSPPPVGTPLEWTLPPERRLWFDRRTGRRLDF